MFVLAEVILWGTYTEISGSKCSAYHHQLGVDGGGINCYRSARTEKGAQLYQIRKVSYTYLCSATVPSDFLNQERKIETNKPMAVWYDTSDTAFTWCKLASPTSISVFVHANSCTNLYHMVHAFFPLLLHWQHQLCYIPPSFPSWYLLQLF